MIGQEAGHESRGTPCNGERAHQATQVLIVQVQIGHHGLEEVGQDEAVDTYQAEGKAQDKHDLPFVGRIPALLC